MEVREYETMYRVEDEHWWYVGLRDLVFYAIHRYATGGVKLLDAGCGTGAFLARCGGFQAQGFDFSEQALEFCRRRRLSNVALGSITDIPFADGSFDIAVSLDVLYHVGVEDDARALGELRRVLAPGGVLILNLPAYQFLTSAHDRAIHTRHRYTAREVGAKARSAGFEVLKLTYRNALLFPLALAGRMLKRLARWGEVRSDLALPSPFVNGFLTRVLLFENRLLRHINFPFGLSVFCVLRKK